MKNIFLLLLLTASNLVWAQNKDSRIAFYNSDSTQIGFKDQDGNITIPATLSPITPARRLEHILTIAKPKNNEQQVFFRTIAGEKIKTLSPYIYDNAFDCESEGFIRFKKKGKTGMLNRRGEIVIPAEYSDLSRVQNGLVFALKNAKEESTTNGEYRSWIGGEAMLLDTNNRVLVQDFHPPQTINYYSMQVSPSRGKDSSLIYFEGTNGQYYAFTTDDKEFKTWWKSTFLSELTPAHFAAMAYDTISHWEEGRGWVRTAKSAYIAQHYLALKQQFLAAKKHSSSVGIFPDELLLSLCDQKDILKYFNNCNDFQSWKNPLMDVRLTNINGGQNHFEFLKTTQGYRLIAVSMKEDLPYTLSDCVRAPAKPIVKKGVFKHTDFQIKKDSITAVETVSFDNGDKVIIRNRGCEYVTLQFQFLTSEFQPDSMNIRYGYQQAYF